MIDKHLLTGTSFMSYETGSYARVFVDDGRLRAIKLFYRKSNRAHVAEVFDSELKAYELVQKSPELMRLTPIFHGRRRVAGVVDGKCEDVSDIYELDLAFELEFVPERFEKITTLGEREQDICRVFHKHDIRYTQDASAAVRMDGSIRLIDFATHWVEPFHED